jgi:hypothetical protein
MRWIYCGEESLAFANVNYLQYDIEYDESMSEGDVSFEDLDETHRYFKLFKECVLQHVVEDCKHHHYYAQLPFCLLPDDLQQQVDADYLFWHTDNVGDLFETNGKILVIDREYAELTKQSADSPYVKQAKDMLQHMKATNKDWASNGDESQVEKFYDINISIIYNDKLFTVPNNAAIFNALEDCLKSYINES